MHLRWPASEWRIVAALALAKLLFHLVTFHGYGIFRDELYYLACGRHLAWGYVEFPPLIAVLARVVTTLLGDSLFAIRLLPALAGAGLVVLTAMIARELGGGRFAQALAGLAVIVTPAWMSIDHFLNTNAFEPLFWAGCVWLALRAWNTGDSTYWLGFGVVAGLGLENKHAMLFFGFGFVAGMLLTPLRKSFTQRNLWLGGVIAALIFLPNVLWEIRLHWPTLEFLQNAVKYKNAILTPWQFFTTELGLTVGAVPVWLAGLWFFFFHPRGRTYRALGWAYLIIFATLCMLHGKGYYLLPAYPMLLGAGGVWLEEALVQRRRWLRRTLITTMLVSAAVSAPMAIPLLPVETFVRYAAWLGIQNPKEERHVMGRLPQFYADMFGWRNIAQQVADVFHSLPPADQAHAAILAWNYGDAGAIDYYGRGLEIPNAISGHNNYYLWGPGPTDPQVVIVIGGSREGVGRMFADVRAAGLITDLNAMPFENNLTIWVCRQRKIPLRQLWPKLKHYV